MKRMLGLSYARPLKETEGPQAELRGAAAIKAVGSWQAGGGLRLDSDARGFWLLYDPTLPLTLALALALTLTLTLRDETWRRVAARWLEIIRQLEGA